MSDQWRADVQRYTEFIKILKSKDTDMKVCYLTFVHPSSAI